MSLQTKINENVDYLYNNQVDETAHQNHRITWIIAAQTLLFTGFCSIIDDGSQNIIALLISVGVCLSISGIYSMLVGELSLGIILEKWGDYSSKSIRQKRRVIPHHVILAPPTVLKSKWQFLMLYKFMPNVFCAAWLMLLTNYSIYACNGIPLSKEILIAGFCAILIVICLLSSVLGKHLLYQWSYYDTLDKRTQAIVGNNCRCNHRYSRHCNPYCGSHYKTTIPFIRTHRKQCKPIISSGTRIYHIMIDRFNGGWASPPENASSFLGGNINGIIDRLDYILSKHFDTILLTPFYSSNAYHGYHITDFEEVDSHFGSWEDFSRLLIEAHRRGMKVFCDFVPNHCHFNNKIFQEALNNPSSRYREWFYFDASRLGGFVSYQNYPDLPKINLYNSEAINYVVEQAARLARLGVDGLRIDHAIGVPFDFLRVLRNRLKSINSNIFIFGEVWPEHLNDYSQVEFISAERKAEVMHNNDNVQENIQLDYRLVFDGILDFRFRDIMLQRIVANDNIWNNDELVEELNEHFSNYSPYSFVPLLFLDNHDLDRLMYYCNGDTNRADRAISYMQSLNYPSIVYYGTECHLTNYPSIFSNNSESNADVRVRQPMDWR